MIFYSPWCYFIQSWQVVYLCICICICVCVCVFEFAFLALFQCKEKGLTFKLLQKWKEFQMHELTNSFGIIATYLYKLWIQLREGAFYFLMTKMTSLFNYIGHSTRYHCISGTCIPYDLGNTSVSFTRRSYHETRPLSLFSVSLQLESQILCYPLRGYCGGLAHEKMALVGN